LKIYWIILVLLLIVFSTGCTKNEVKGEFDFTSWDEDKVYDYLNEVDQYVKEIPTESNSKEQIVRMYEKYFSPELSQAIFDSLYIKTDNKWNVIQGDSGFIFHVPSESDSDGSKVSIEFNMEYIRILETSEFGMYSEVEYVIRYTNNPLITEWREE